jgi:phosphoenolpyruvate-protein phosphotransferase
VGDRFDPAGGAVTRLRVLAPLAGWALPLAQVCDEAFASGMVGDGVAIDPTDGVLHAPCDGVVVLPGEAQHALTVRHASGCELLLHVGIDTVALRGDGFERLVVAGQRVRAGEPLLRFDLDRVAQRARSAVTPLLIASGGRLVTTHVDRAVAVGDLLFEVELDGVEESPAFGGTESTRRFRVPFDHGLHARPASQLVAALRPLVCEVSIRAHGRDADARSAVSLMGLGVQSGDEVEVTARGTDADAALDALAALLVAVDVGLVPTVPAAAATSATPMPDTLDGVVAARGLAIGRAVRLERKPPVVAAASRGEAVERDLLRTALAQVNSHIGRLALDARGAQQEVLDAHRTLLQDPELQRLSDASLRRGRSAGDAWREATSAVAARLAQLADARLAERAADLRDLEHQVLRALAGEAPDDAHVLPEDAILVVGELLPSQFAALDASRIAGICMAHGGPTSHAALLAAARGIPTLVALGDSLLRIDDGTVLLLDAERGVLRIAPSPAQQSALREKIATRAAREASDLAAAHDPALTRDGTAIAVLANIGALAESTPAVARGAEGCGLLRTEFLFLDRRAAPDEDEQVRVYAGVASAFGARPLTIRTLDVGGDKPLAYLPLPREENPALGVRGLRVGLRAPDILRTQLRAVLRASTAGNVRVMLPMVNDLAELRAVRALFDDCRRDSGSAASPALGVMIETPAAALLADQLAREADFLSIGSNDLSQYVLAMDRAHPELAMHLDGLHPAVLRLIDGVARAGLRAGRSVSVCGGLASDPDAVPILIGLGIHELSAVPASIPRIKRRVRELDAARCAQLAAAALDCTSAAEVRALVARSVADGAVVAVQANDAGAPNAATKITRSA